MMATSCAGTGANEVGLVGVCVCCVPRNWPPELRPVARKGTVGRSGGADGDGGGDCGEGERESIGGGGRHGPVHGAALAADSQRPALVNRINKMY